jgi:hypothetical protein
MELSAQVLTAQCPLHSGLGGLQSRSGKTLPPQRPDQLWRTSNLRTSDHSPQTIRKSYIHYPIRLHGVVLK